MEVLAGLAKEQTLSAMNQVLTSKRGRRRKLTGVGVLTVSFLKFVPAVVVQEVSNLLGPIGKPIITVRLSTAVLGPSQVG